MKRSGEKHHIKPRSLFPELAKDPDNIVKLTYREHYVCHHLLYKIYEEKNDKNALFKMLSAWLRMCKNTDGMHVTARQFEIVKQKIIERNRILQKNRTEESKKRQSDLIKSYKWWNNGIITTRALNCPGAEWVEGRYYDHPLKKDIPKVLKKAGRRFGSIPWNKGMKGVYTAKPCSEERKRKISEANKGRPGSMLGKKFTQEHKDNISKALLGKPSHKQSEETRKIIGDAARGRTFWNNGIEMRFQKESPGEGWVKGKIK